MNYELLSSVVWRLVSCVLGLVSSTIVENPLQIGPFLQNEPKFRKSQMNVNKVLTMNYEKKDTWWTRKKRTQNKPKQTQSPKSQNERK